MLQQTKKYCTDYKHFLRNYRIIGNCNTLRKMLQESLRFAELDRIIYLSEDFDFSFGGFFLVPIFFLKPKLPFSFHFIISIVSLSQVSLLFYLSLSNHSCFVYLSQASNLILNRIHSTPLHCSHSHPLLTIHFTELNYSG